VAYSGCRAAHPSTRSGSASRQPPGTLCPLREGESGRCGSHSVVLRPSTKGVGGDSDRQPAPPVPRLVCGHGEFVLDMPRVARPRPFWLTLPGACGWN
jgi:hypothetical protein